MEDAATLIVQSGSLGLLGYLIFWTTRSGAPRLFETLSGIQKAIEMNATKIEAMEQTQRMHTEVLMRMVEGPKKKV